MDRLTTIDGMGNNELRRCFDCSDPGEDNNNCGMCKCFQEMIDRLAAYEDKGMEPSDMLDAVEMAKVACALQKLKSYEDAAERSGWISVKDGQMSGVTGRRRGLPLQAYGDYETFDHEPSEDEAMTVAERILSEMVGTIIIRGMIRKSNLTDPLQPTWTVGLKVYLPAEGPDDDRA